MRTVSAVALFPIALVLAALAEGGGVAPGVVMALPAIVMFVAIACLGLRRAWLAGRGEDAGTATAAKASGAALPSWALGAGLAAEHLAPAVLLAGTAGIYAAGFDGLPVAIAGASGVALAAMVIAPRLMFGGAASPAAAIAFGLTSGAGGLAGAAAVSASGDGGGGGGAGVRGAAIVAQAVWGGAGLLLVAGVLGGGSAVLAALTGLDEGAALVAAAAGVLVVAIGGQALRTGLRGLAAYAAILIGIGLPLVIIATARYGLPLPQVAYGQALAAIERSELRLIEGGLIDFEFFRAHATPFLSTTILNVLALTVVLALGAACQPATFRAAAVAGHPGKARRVMLWGAGLAGLVATLLPAAAAYAKLAIEETVLAAATFAALPAWTYAAGELGLLKICGVAAVDAAAIVEACRALPDHAGRPLLHDFQVLRNGELIALPVIASMPAVVVGGMMAAAATAGVLAPAAVLQALVAADGRQQGGGSIAGRIIRQAFVMAILCSVAVGLAAGGGIGFLDGLSWSASLAAGGLFAPLMLALWWRRATAWGVLAGMAAGAGVTLYYIVGTRYFAADFHDLWGWLGTASVTALEDYAALIASQAGADAIARLAIAAEVDRQAQALAGWWGVRNLAAGIFGLPVAFVVTVAVSVLGPRRRAH